MIRPSAPCEARRAAALPLLRDAADLGLRRTVVPTTVGPVVVRATAPGPDTATVLLHGAAGSWTTWTPLLAAADRAGRPVTDVVALDLPGWGDSPAPSRPLEVADASAAVAEVLGALGRRRWTVLGHSLGGFVALDLAVREPRRTLAVGLVSASGAGIVDTARRPVRGGARLPWFAGMLLAMHALATLPGEGRALLRLLDRIGLLGPLSAPLFADRRSVHPSVVAALAEEVRPTAFTAAVRAAAGYDLGAWRTIRCPVRSVRGARDVFVGRRDAALLAASVPDLAATVLPGAGHFAAVEQPLAVLDALLPVVTRTPARGPA